VGRGGVGGGGEGGDDQIPKPVSTHAADRARTACITQILLANATLVVSKRVYMSPAFPKEGGREGDGGSKMEHEQTAC
jgi:hypothetical protein